MIAAEGGGGGGFTVDRGALGDIAGSLSSASSDMDGIGSGTPGTGGGDAAPLLAAILAGFTDAGARLVVEASTIATTVSECADSYGTADAAQAESYLITGAAG